MAPVFVAAGAIAAMNRRSHRRHVRHEYNSSHSQASGWNTGSGYSSDVCDKERASADPLQHSYDCRCDRCWMLRDEEAEDLESMVE